MVDELLMLVVAVLSLWGGWRNVTCWALAAAYFAVQLWWLAGGTLGVDDLFLVDVAVILLIFGKAVRHDTCCYYKSGLEQLRCLLTAPTIHDRVILAIFAGVVWPSYALTIGDYERWWVLWFASMAQFLIAGAEAVKHYRESTRERARPRDSSSNDLMRVAWAGSAWRDG